MLRQGSSWPCLALLLLTPLHIHWWLCPEKKSLAQHLDSQDRSSVFQFSDLLIYYSPPKTVVK